MNTLAVSLFYVNLTLKRNREKSQATINIWNKVQKRNEKYEELFVASVTAYIAVSSYAVIVFYLMFVTQLSL